MTEDPSRRSRRSGPRDGRHRALGRGQFASSFTALGTLAYTGARVSAHVDDADSGQTLLTIDDRVVQPVGAIGALLLLIEVSARLTAGESGYTLLERMTPPAAGRTSGTGAASGIESGSNLAEPANDRAAETRDHPDPALTNSAVAHRGLWSRLKVPALPVLDLAVLAGATGDPAAINALLRHVTASAVRDRADGLGLKRTALLDVMRETRGPDDAPHFAVGATAELAALMARLHRGEVVDAAASARVLHWLTGGVSLIAAALGPEPLGSEFLGTKELGWVPQPPEGAGSGASASGAASTRQRGMRVISACCVEAGLRAETGLLFGPRGVAAYAVSIEFDEDSSASRLRVSDTLRTVGLDLMEYLG